MMPAQRPPGVPGALTLVCALLLACAIPGCASVPPRAAGGALPVVPVSVPPPPEAGCRHPSVWSRIGQSAARAVLSPSVWAPSAVALLLQIDDLDRRISDWARRETPVFGSRDGADRTSDVLLKASVVPYATVLILTPGPPGIGPWTLEKSGRGLVGFAAYLATDQVTREIKHTTARMRPDSSDALSLPSGHASISAVGASLSAAEVQRLQGPEWVRTTVVLGSGMIAGGCAWARVEAGRHYPSDVLSGWALGTWMGTFAYGVLPSAPGGRASSPVSLRIGRRRFQVAISVGLPARE
jgi:hypothetical protein